MTYVDKITKRNIQSRYLGKAACVLAPAAGITECPDLVEETLSDAALDVSYHVHNTQPCGCTLMLRASPGLSSAALPASPLPPASIASPHPPAAAQAPFFFWSVATGSSWKASPPITALGSALERGRERLSGRLRFRFLFIVLSWRVPKQSVLVS